MGVRTVSITYPGYKVLTPVQDQMACALLLRQELRNSLGGGILGQEIL